jgi:hypothetical protein
MTQNQDFFWGVQMGIVYKKLTTSDLEVYIQMRIEQLREEGAKEDIDLVPALRDYYSRHMADGTFVSWLGTVTK